MQNIGFPFNQKQHIFDFKVKVNFQNGNVSLTAPQIVTPPALFNNQPIYNQNIQHSHSPITFSHNQVNTNVQNLQIQQNSVHIPPQFTPIHHPQQISNPYQFQKCQQIQLVNSSYTSLNENNDQSINNNSMQMIQCVLCQKSFNANELQHHLQLHRNRANNNKNNISTQKNNVSNYAMTQNSVNGVNDSVLSDQRNNSSFQSQSYQSQNSYNQSFQKSNNKSSSFNTSNIVGNANSMNFITRRQEMQKKQQNEQNINNLRNINQSLQSNQNNSQNESLPLLGRIQNPILALKAQQQQQSSSLSHSYSSQPNNQSLNYSNSQGQQSTTRFNNPISSVNPHDQSPQFHNPQSNNSSFGNMPGSNVIGPSFYHNSSHQSGNLISNSNNAPFFKGINRLAYNQSNGSLEMQVPLITNPIPVQNQSFHSNHSNSINNSGHLSQNSNQFIQPPMNIHNGSQQYSNPSSNFSNLRNSIQSNHSSFGSNGSLHANFMPVSNNSNPIYHNFQTIQSRYLNQPGSNSRQLYGSYQEINNFQQSRNRNMMRKQDAPFSESDISSISYQSRADLSQYSDWSDLHSKSQQKLQGYQSADNSIIKNMQHQQSRQDKNNFYISRRSKNENEKEENNFFKKKKDYMISSAASYYEKKFKDDASSSSDEDNVYKTGRLSYAQRLKEKRTSDNLKSLQMSQAKSMNKLKNSHRSNKSNNLSKYSDDSNMSKTKLPVNYLAREQFISTSSTSKSTHKTSAPN